MFLDSVSATFCPVPKAMGSQAELGNFQQSLAVYKVEHDIGIRIRSSMGSVGEECAREDMGDASAKGDPPIQLIPGVSFERLTHVRSRVSGFVTSDQFAGDIVDPVCGVCETEIQVLANHE